MWISRASFKPLNERHWVTPHSASVNNVLESFTRSTHVLNFLGGFFSPFPFPVTSEVMVCLVTFTLWTRYFSFNRGRTVKHSPREQEVKTHPKWKLSITCLDIAVCFSWNTIPCVQSCLPAFRMSTQTCLALISKDRHWLQHSEDGWHHVVVGEGTF